MGQAPKTKLSSPLIVPSGSVSLGVGRRRIGLGPRAGQQVAELGQPDVDPRVVHLSVARVRGRADAGDVEGIGVDRGALVGVLQGIGRVELADRVAEVRGVGGARGAHGAGEVAGGVERDPPVEADDQEGEQRLGEPAARVGTGRVAQVEPDRIGDAVGVVIDVEGDLAGGRVGHQVGEGRRVMAVGRDRPEDPRRRVGPVAGAGWCGPSR